MTVCRILSGPFKDHPSTCGRHIACLSKSRHFNFWQYYTHILLVYSYSYIYISILLKSVSWNCACVCIRPFWQICLLILIPLKLDIFTSVVWLHGESQCCCMQCYDAYTYISIQLCRYGMLVCDKFTNVFIASCSLTLLGSPSFHQVVQHKSWLGSSMNCLIDLIN